MTNGNSTITDITDAFLHLNAVTLVYFIIGTVMYKAVDHKARIDGKLGVY